MSAHHDEPSHDGSGHHGGHHEAFSIGGWVDQHLSGAVTPFGTTMEKVFERTLVLSVNGFFLKASRLCLVIMTPVLLLEFVLRAGGF